MKNYKKIIPIILAVLIIGGGAFFGGIKYSESKRPNSANFQNFRNLTPEQIQQRAGQAGSAGTRFGNGQNVATGEIISKDDSTITLKLSDGGSKIIFYSDSTQISKTIEATTNDLQVGETLMVNGQANDDGSLTAQTIQLRPNLPNLNPNQNPAATNTNTGSN